MRWFKKKLPITFPFQKKPHSPETGSYRKLVTRLLLKEKVQDCRVILITSAGVGEGKSTTAVNIALMLAEMNKRVVLIDADLRRPTLDKALKLPNENGLTGYLVKDATEENLGMHAVTKGLEVVTCGPPLESAGALSGFSGEIEALIELLKSKTDYIIIDTSPVLATSDPLILASLVDAVLLVVRHKVTTRQSGQQAVALLKETGANILGVVLNDAAQSLNGRYYS